MAKFDIKLNYSSGFPSNLKTFVEKARLRWLEILIGDFDEFEDEDGYIYDKLNIDVSLVAIDGKPVRGNKYAEAGPIIVSPYNYLPLRSVLRIDKDDIGDLLKAPELLFDVILHEVGHAIGIDKFSWDIHKIYKVRNNENSVLTGSSCRKEYQAYANLSSPTDLPLFKLDGSLHIDEATFPMELMSPGIVAGGNKLSRLSIAMLEDIGYDVDYTSADSYNADEDWKLMEAPIHICRYDLPKPRIARPRTS